MLSAPPLTESLEKIAHSLSRLFLVSIRRLDHVFSQLNLVSLIHTVVYIYMIGFA